MDGRDRLRIRRAALGALVAAAFAWASGATAATPLSVGTPPFLDWGDHRLDLQVGWPVQAIGLAWGTRSGWSPGLHVTLDLRAPAATPGVGFSLARPFAHGARTSGYAHLAASLLMRRPAGARFQLGGELDGGVTLGIGLGARRRATLELAFVPGLRVGPGLGAPGPQLALRGALGVTFHLAPDVGLSLRGRGGIEGLPPDPPAPVWEAAAVVTRRF